MEQKNKEIENLKQKQEELQKDEVQQKADNRIAEQEKLLRDKADKLKEENEKRLRVVQERMEKQEKDLYKKQVDSEIELNNEKNKLKISEMKTKSDLEEQLRKAEDKVIDKGITQSEKILETSYEDKLKDL